MPTDAVVVEGEERIELEPAVVTTVVQFKPISVGRSYVVWGMGLVAARGTPLTIELEAFDAKQGLEFGVGDSWVNRPLGRVTREIARLKAAFGSRKCAPLVRQSASSRSAFRRS
jgi:hypothetical protein